MEDLSKRVPMLNRLILNYIDDNTLVTFEKTSREIHQVLENDKRYWIRIIKKYNGNLTKFQGSWQNVISQTPVHIVKELAVAVQKFFTEQSKSCR